MITRLPGRATIAIATTFILASVLLTLYVWRSVGGTVPLQPKRYHVTALFDNASQLTRNADVRISGVDIGSVEDIRAQGLYTEATLSVEARFAPLPADVRAVLRQKTLLGETYVELSPGSARAPRIPEGGAIAREQIADTQPLDRVLGMLDTRTRERMVELFTDSAAVLDGRGADFNAGLGNLALGTRQLAATVAILDDQREDVGALVDDAGDVLDEVGDQRDAVAELIASGHRVLSATAQRADALTRTIEAAPEALRELRATAVAAQGTAALAAPVLAQFRPLAPLITPALESTRDVAPRLGALLEDIEPLVPVARRALPAGARIVEAITPLMRALEPAAAQIVPLVPYMATYRGELIATMANIGASTNGSSFATNGEMTPYLRTLIPVGPETNVGYEQRLGSNRHNAYRAPGGLAELAEGLASASCEHASDSADAPPCRVQEGWSFQGAAPAYFQRIGPASAGGAMARLRAALAAALR